MPLHYRPDYDQHIAVITAEGTVTFDECTELCDRQRADVPRRLHELNDYRGARLDLTATQTRRLAELNVALYAGVPSMRLAIVADSGLSYGLSRVMEAYLEDNLELRIFEDYEEAMTWIREAADRESDEPAGRS